MKKFNLVFLLSIVFLFGCESSILDDPSTKIGFSIPQRSHVKLTVENSYNTVIATLVDGESSAGSFSVDFNSSNLAEGVYFYILEVRGLETNDYYSQTKHMLLVK